MRKPVKTATVLFGLGVGLAVGQALGPAAAWSGFVIAALGVGLYLFGGKESDLVAEGLADRDADAVVTGDGPTIRPAAGSERLRRGRQRPTFSEMGPYVEEMLALAEEQADHHRAEARREAEGIVTAARREAEAILKRAHEQAAGTAGAGRDPFSAPPARAPSPDEGPSPFV